VTRSSSNLAVDRAEKRIAVALPIRVTYYDAESKPRLEMACTYDISSHGARISGLRCVKKAGEILIIERGRSKAFCRVVWVGEANSHLHGQIGIRCVEAQKTLWTAELHEVEEVYDPILRDDALCRLNAVCSGPNTTRRRYQRLAADGGVEILQMASPASHQECRLKDVSESGCRVMSESLILPGTDLKLVLNVANCDLSFRGQVRHAALDVGLGIEFREVRKGDRAVLQHILRKLAESQSAEQGNREKARGNSVATLV